MSPQNHRLPGDTPKVFSGGQIDRSKPISFRLDGRVIPGFVGDTILSAVLAAGIDILGRCDGSPVALGLRATPAIAHANREANGPVALSMARTPAANALDLRTLSATPPSELTRWLRPGRTLGLSLDAPRALGHSWREQPAVAQPKTDLLVIGGGVAGLSAALAAAHGGLKVTLVEANPYLGGQSGLFGTQEDEKSPEDDMARLGEAVRSSDAIRVMLRTRAFALRPGLVRAHLIDTTERLPQGAIVDLPAARIIIATGSLERLPLVPGNRLPGVVGSAEAFELAHRYAVWPGRQAIIATNSNAAYRLAMLAQDAGVAIDRILDSRAHPVSRFIEFAKAYGIRQFPGTVPQRLDLSRGGDLAMHWDREEQGAKADRVVLCGGWQPDLTLWHVAGGISTWCGDRHRLEATGEVESIALAGSAAGYLTRSGCRQSGADAVDQLLGRSRQPVEDPVIDPIYESPDGANFYSSALEAAPTYLDGGTSLLQRPEPPTKKWSPPWGKKGLHSLSALSDAPQPLTIGQVAAGVDIDLIPAGSAGIVAAERVALVPLPDPVEATSAPLADDHPKLLPPYLIGRFEDARLVLVQPSDKRTIEPGALIHRHSDDHDPLTALGVVIRLHEKGVVAIVADHAPKSVTVRDSGREIAAQIEDLE